MDQTVNSNKPLCRIDKRQCCALTKLLCKYSYDHACGMMKVHFFSTVNQEGAACASFVQYVDGKESLKDGYCTIMLAECHRRHYAQMFEDKD